MSPQNPTPIRVLLVDEHRIELWGLEKLIERERPRLEFIGSATNNAEALDMMDKVFPDVIVLGMNFGEENGLDAISGLVAKSKAKILVLTESRDHSIYEKAVLAGANGIVRKQDPTETILKAIEQVHAGQLWLDHVTTGRIFVALSRKSAAKDVDPERRKIATLTPREREIIVVIATNAGAKVKAVAEMLHISESTLRNHLTSIHGKLEVANHLELFVYANKHGLNKPD